MYIPRLTRAREYSDGGIQKSSIVANIPDFWHFDPEFAQVESVSDRLCPMLKPISELFIDFGSWFR